MRGIPYVREKGVECGREGGLVIFLRLAKAPRPSTEVIILTQLVIPQERATGNHVFLVTQTTASFPFSLFFR